MRCSDKSPTLDPGGQETDGTALDMSVGCEGREIFVGGGKVAATEPQSTQHSRQNIPLEVC